MTLENWIIFLLGLICAIPLGIFVNIFTPRVQSFINTSSLASRKRRIASLAKQYKQRKEFKDDPILYILDRIRWLNYLLVGLIFMVFCVGLLILGLILNASNSSIISFLSSLYFVIPGAFGLFLVFATVIILTTGLNDSVDEWKNFDNYKNRIIAEVEKLGGNPEDLDKEETA